MQALRRRRVWLPLLLVGTLLFAQLAAAAHACARLAAEVGDTSEMMPGCPGHGAPADPEQPGLCKAHCQAGQQTVDRDLRTPDVPPAMPAALWAAVDVAAWGPDASRPPPPATSGPPPDPLPLYLRLLVLRN